jgi:hypothetical protein
MIRREQMSDRPDEFRSPRGGGAEPAIWVTAALSLLIHAVVLLGLPRMRLPLLNQSEWSDARRSLSVNLAPLPLPPAPPSSARPTQPARTLRARPPVTARTRPAPPVIARKAPAPARSFEGDDLSSYIEARRRARAASVAAPAASPPSAPSEDEEARRDRVATANPALPRVPASGYDPRIKRGTFQVQRVGLDDAEFIFHGWDEDAGRNIARLVEVRRGANRDIRIAVVRRIIAIIRERERGDFLWESARMGRSLTLSARARDNARLEDFMMHEFFNDPFPAR